MSNRSPLEDAHTATETRRRVERSVQELTYVLGRKPTVEEARRYMAVIAGTVELIGEEAANG